jgi:ubiquinone biosynthesis protein COQ9
MMVNGWRQIKKKEEGLHNLLPQTMFSQDTIVEERKSLSYENKFVACKNQQGMQQVRNYFQVSLSKLKNITCLPTP